MKEQTKKTQSGILIALVLIAAVSAGVIGFVLFDKSGSKGQLGPEYSYDIESYARIDPTLILYRQVGATLETGFQIAHAIAVDTEGQIYVAGDQKIAVYTAAGDSVKQLELSAEPTCIEIDNDGTILVGLTDRIGMIKMSETEEWKAPASNALLTSLAVDKDNIFAADAVSKVVWRYDRKSNLLNKIGEKNPQRNIPGIIVPSPYFDIAMAADGLLRVVNPGRHLIEAYTVEGHREWAWGKTSISVEGFSGCCNPVSFAILPDGGFVTCEKGLVRVKVYDADGKFIGVVAGPDQLGWVEPLRVCETPDQCGSKGFDVAADSKGRIYILDTVRNNVKVFEKK